ncbi:hypothetical protein B0H17DRAFT_1144591 [Mycena rosella]|uniref:Uncharacterized protein n=1 Tax=Mycena rosella TaxID=1033263 RepID=A0AAD7CT88_MYCRO|nr:hypothetical protein B0H17DRAFT_1144591 [Mycena rosella]
MAWPCGQVEWFSSFRPSHEPNHNMFAISKPPPRADGSLRGSVIYLSDIPQICQLFPNFGWADVDLQWTSDNVLAFQIFLMGLKSSIVWLMSAGRTKAQNGAKRAQMYGADTVSQGGHRQEGIEVNERGKSTNATVMINQPREDHHLHRRSASLGAPRAGESPESDAMPRE